MKDNTVWIIGCACGLIVVLAVALISFFVRRKKNDSPKFDERQMIARNRAYKYSFFTLIFYNILCGFLSMAEIVWATLLVQMFIGVFIAVSVFVILCILQNAYDGFNQKSGSFLSFWLMVTLLNMVVFIFNLIEGVSFFTDGALNYHSLNPMIALMFIVVSIVQIVKMQMDKKAVEE